MKCFCRIDYCIMKNYHDFTTFLYMKFTKNVCDEVIDFIENTATDQNVNLKQSKLRIKSQRQLWVTSGKLTSRKSNGSMLSRSCDVLLSSQKTQRQK